MRWSKRVQHRMNEMLVNKVIIKFPLIRQGFQFSFASFLKVNFNSIKMFNYGGSTNERESGTNEN